MCRSVLQEHGCVVSCDIRHFRTACKRAVLLFPILICACSLFILPLRGEKRKGMRWEGVLMPQCFHIIVVTAGQGCTHKNDFPKKFEANVMNW